MSLVDDLIAEQTAEQIEARVLSVMAGVGIAVTSFVIGSPSEQLFQIFSLLLKWMADIIRAANQAQFIDTAYDPGDFDDQEPRKGWLSYKGLADYNTERTDNTFATGFVTLSNGGSTTHPILSERLTFQNVTTEQNYRNVFDGSLYVGANKTLTLAPGESVTIPVRAEKVGTIANAAPGEITRIVTSLQGVAVTNASPVLGTDRETRDKYIARCKLAAAATSPNGPAAAYEYIALNTNSDGTLGSADDGKTKVNVTRIQVTKDSDYGVVRVWLASPSGPATSDDVIAVNAAISLWAVPDAVTVIVAAAVAVPVTVTGVVTANASPGLVGSTVSAAAATAVQLFFPDIPVGGFDGMLYKDKVSGVAVQSHNAAYHCTLSFPSTDTVIADGEVVTLVGNNFSAVLQ